MNHVFVKLFFNNTVMPFYLSNELDVKFGDYVIVETKYGNDMGKVLSNRVELKANETMKVLSKATEKDIQTFNANRKKDQLEDPKIKGILKKYHPDIHFIGCYFMLDGTKLIINYISDTRIDFRETVKELASIYKTRIEMRQISSREGFKLKGGIGICGRECCCSSFYHLKQHITASMVREQNLSEINAKTIGPCGKLLCCLSYESDLYKNGKHVCSCSKTNVNKILENVV
ncbi:MAG: regulatory iron-sulfur-containing complex subunit RicT [Spirochaetia bacterium]|nr:hypothetical protein [Spirochaetota bacterium]MCX8095902.1 hypothetical protein [Spirochaetota bacterium]MDW8112262.1 regulatory iron-sulfur-containing complex subunit RicT [Spirochaetia bacterium]